MHPDESLKRIKSNNVRARNMQQRNIRKKGTIQKALVFVVIMKMGLLVFLDYLIT